MSRLVLASEAAAPGRADGDLAAPLGALLSPRVVAVLGVSEDRAKLGTTILSNVISNGFGGAVYGIGRDSFELPGARIVRRIDDVPEPIDVLLLAVPAAALAASIAQIPPGKVRVAVAIASGFSETGEQGTALEAEVLQACRRSGVALIGPNCQGAVVPNARLQMTFSPMYNRMVAGPVAVISQSGAMGGFMVNRLMQRGVGVSCFISSGNEIDLQAADYIAAFGAQADTRVLLCYLEQIRDGHRFAAAVRSLPPGKRVVAVKCGRTNAGAAAVRSHTGAIAVDDRIIDGVFEQLGVLRAPDSASAVDAAAALAAGKMLRGLRIGILSIAGGLAVELADLLEMKGFEVPPFSEATIARLRGIVPAFGATRNPIDLTGAVLTDDTLFGNALDIMAADPGLDGYAIISTFVRDPRIAESIIALHRRSDKPVVVCWTGGADQTPESLQMLAGAGVPVYDNTARAAWAMHALRPRGGPEPGAQAACANAAADAASLRNMLRCWQAAGRVQINEFDSKSVLGRAGLPLPAAPVPGGSAVVKLCADSHLHKTEFGLLRLRVPFECIEVVGDELRARGEQLGIAGSPLLYEAMVDDGLLEWFVGCKDDARMGPIIVLGVGGIYAELFGAPLIRMAPLSVDDAQALIRSHPAFPVIAGARGRPPADLRGFAEVVSSVSRLFVAVADLVDEIDLNPVIVRPAGSGPAAVIADAAIVLKAPAP